MQTARSTGTQFSVQGTARNTTAGVRQALPCGATVEATVEQDRTTSDRAPEQQTARLGLSVTQALLRGFGPAANLASVRQAELETLASLYELRGFTEAVLAETEIAYWNYVLAKQEITIFERSLALAEQQLDVIEQRIEVGVLPQVEVAPARAEVARRKQALIDARSDAAITNLEQIVRLDVRLAVNEVERARKQIAASKATRVFEEETLAAENKRFDVGAGTALLVAQAQRDLLAGSIVEVQAVINYRVALVRLYVAEGSLLERRGIRMPAGNESQGPY